MTAVDGALNFVFAGYHSVHSADGHTLDFYDVFGVASRMLTFCAPSTAMLRKSSAGGIPFGSLRIPLSFLRCKRVQDSVFSG